MTAQRHTAAPWEAKALDAYHFIILSADGGSVGKTQLPLPAMVDVMPVSIKANAQLMAASPELLSSLRECLGLVRLKYGNLDADVNEVMERAAAVIMKADPR